MGYDVSMNNEQFWQAVLKRDARADGTFVYAVRSTKVYCRPSCPSRRPSRAQVLFFAEPDAADALLHAVLTAPLRERMARDALGLLRKLDPLAAFHGRCARLLALVRVPGVAARVVDPETFRPLPPGAEGMAAAHHFDLSL